MPIRRTDTPLANELLDFCRKGGHKLTAAALAAPDGTHVLQALTGGPVPPDPAARTALARWLVLDIRENITRLGNRMDTEIATVEFAADPSRFGRNVGQRLKDACQTGALRRNEFWKHRKRVAEEIAAAVTHDYQVWQENYFFAPAPRPRLTDNVGIRRSPTICLVGYDDDTAVDPFAEELGTVLAHVPLPVDLVSFASRVLLRTGYAMAAESITMNTYTPDRYTLFRRTTSRRAQPIHRYLGRTECLPGTIDEAREQVIAEADLLIAFGGDEGTAHEIELAHQFGVPVIPIAATGGAARDDWNTGSNTPRTHPAFATAYHDLANPRLTVAVHAAAHVATHLLLDPPT